jgi:hypothetical protein
MQFYRFEIYFKIYHIRFYSDTLSIVLKLINFNSLKRSGNYVYHLLYQSVAQNSFFGGSCMVLRVNSDYFLKHR